MGVTVKRLAWLSSPANALVLGLNPFRFERRLWTWSSLVRQVRQLGVFRVNALLGHLRLVNALVWRETRFVLGRVVVCFKIRRACGPFQVESNERTMISGFKTVPRASGGVPLTFLVFH